MGTPLATLERGGCRAEIYENALPGEFTIRYFDAAGGMVAEEGLSGVSSYHQRETEILARLEELSKGRRPDLGGLSHSGEY